jgi:hypothetical protein
LSTTLHPGAHRVQVYAPAGIVRIRVKTGSVTVPSITIPNTYPGFTVRQKDGTVTVQANGTTVGNRPWRTISWDHPEALSKLQRLANWLFGTQASYITRSAAMVRITATQTRRRPVTIQPTITVLLPASSGQPQITRSHGGTS